ncbi:nucleotidyl transferase AbiEii/AbiGii toxin family protein [Murdochiella massiliensis]|uniref:nucleotidyl transferase AbiEii/AbiGii toxin family protein n=1 Tax=Murdochiella massiliensis TaxID=1673723 RepID=UPI00096AD12D|nr:nucleotidyl transferase AbiEii/AbiGii toxin family protein [Murdochiella massiliensis]
MNRSIEQMLKNYSVHTVYDKKNAMKEIMQEIVLCGLSRAGFFKQAAFYGGTALRIFYGLDRFSEDLDFSLEEKNPAFDLSAFFPQLKKEVSAFGLNVEISEKEKTKDSSIRSAFLKGNTKEHLLLFYADDPITTNIAKNEVVKIKFEVDVCPPSFATFEHRYRLLPIPYEVKLYDMSSLFAGKVHAVLCRAWQSRIKGRDLYDYVFYLSRGAKLNRRHLCERLIDSGAIPAETECSLAEVKQMLKERFDTIDFVQAKRDVEPFVQDPSTLEVWSSSFFKQITENLSEI